MTTVVEDGSIVAGANSYISDADFSTYANDRGVTINNGAVVTGKVAELLLNAALYVESLYFIGLKLTKDQDMQWPRANVYIDSFAVASSEIPKLLINLQAEVAIAIDAGNNPLNTIERSVKRTKLGPIEKEYADNAAPFAINLKIKALERKLTGISGGSSFQVTRG
tara:strand:- start:104 stop:601 length:498 start_codon:yes stop_codon:yes gene_type:complete